MWEVNRACGRSTGHVGGQPGMLEVNRACGRSIGHVGGQQVIREVNSPNTHLKNDSLPS